MYRETFKRESLVIKTFYSIQNKIICFNMIKNLMEGYLMTNLSIEILVLTALLINLGAILTANIYLKSIKELQRKRLFCGKSLSNPYCIIERFIPVININ